MLSVFFFFLELSLLGCYIKIKDTLLVKKKSTVSALTFFFFFLAPNSSLFLDLGESLKNKKWISSAEFLLSRTDALVWA